MAILVCSQLTISLEIDRELKGIKKKKTKPKPKSEDEQEEKIETPLDKLIKDLNAYFDQKLKPLKPKKDDDGEGNVTYDIPSKNARISMEVSGTKVLVTLLNDYENQSIELENVEFEDQRDLINAEYVEPFLTDMDQIFTDIGQIYASIEKGILGVEYEGSFGKTAFNKAKIDGKAGKDNLKFNLSYLNEGLVMPGEPVTGILARDKGKFVLTMVSKFFQKSFELGILTEGYLESEAAKVGYKILAHLDSMYYLNENPSDQAVEHLFTFADYKKPMEDLIKDKLGKEFDVKTSDSGAVVSLGKTKVLTIKASEQVVGFMAFTVLKSKVEVLAGEESSVVIPGSSIFAMDGLANKYLLEVLDSVMAAVDKVDAGDPVSIFE